MDSTLDEPCGQTSGERRNLRRYMLEFFIAMGSYCVLLPLSIKLRPGHDAAGVAIALLPEIGVVAVTIAIIRFSLRMDEMHRRMMTDAAAIAAVVTVVICMGLGFATNAGVPNVSMIWTFPIACATWGLALPFLRRRYA